MNEPISVSGFTSIPLPSQTFPVGQFVELIPAQMQAGTTIQNPSYNAGNIDIGFGSPTQAAATMSGTDVLGCFVLTLAPGPHSKVELTQRDAYYGPICIRVNASGDRPCGQTPYLNA